MTSTRPNPINTRVVPIRPDDPRLAIDGGFDDRLTRLEQRVTQLEAEQLAFQLAATEYMRLLRGTDDD